MIVVTGAAGFIGSCMLTFLKENGYKDLVGVDDFKFEKKLPNYINKTDILRIDRKELFSFIGAHNFEISHVIHLGARTDTVDKDPEIFLELNINYSIAVWNICTLFKLPLIYASSAATYGNGEHGFDDTFSDFTQLIPLNEYGKSKNYFDFWASEQEATPPNWVGLKFFNVYGPNEYHKGRMASVIFHAYHQIVETGKMKLFKSHNKRFKDGEQQRDFIYVKDVCETIIQIMQKQIKSGIYNLGTGKARSFNDLVNAVFAGLELTPNIEYIDIPMDIRANYQYFTEANMLKLEKQGIDLHFQNLEEGVFDYVTNFLKNKIYL